MAKDTYYFSHDYNARNDEKILELRASYGVEGYGLFWMIVETMAETENGGLKASLIGGLSIAFGISKDKIKDIVKFCLEIELFYEDEGFIYSRRLKKHKEFRVKLSEDGKKGAKNRWGENSPPNSTPNAKERKEKEIKGKENNTGTHLWFLKFFHSDYENYKKVFNGQSTNEKMFLSWKEYVQFIYDKGFTDLFECKFLAPHDYAKLVTKHNFTKDKWEMVSKSLLSTGVKPEHNLFFRIPQFMKYEKIDNGLEADDKIELTDEQKRYMMDNWDGEL